MITNALYCKKLPRDLFGPVCLLCVIGLLLTMSPPARAATFTVNTVADTENPDDGVLSLREAINAANEDSVKDTIQFDIPGPAPHQIDVGSGAAAGMPLPDIFQPVVIDGTTEPDYEDYPVVFLDGTSVVSGFDTHGLFLNTSDRGGADGCEIRGLFIKNFPGSGITMYTNSNLIEGNVINLNGLGILLSTVNLNQILNNEIAG